MNIRKKSIYPVIILLMLLPLLFSCSRDQAESSGTGDGSIAQNIPEAHYSFTDSLGRTVVLEKAPRRVISLLGSYAETWLLAGGELVGVTDDVISERQLDVPDGTTIIGTVKSPNLEKLLELDPDFVLLSTDIEGHVAASRILEQAGIPYAYFKVEQFEDYLGMLKICTDITGRKDLYGRYGLDVQSQIRTVLENVISSEQEPTVLFVRALSGKAKAKADDNMTCRMLEELGTDNIARRHESLLDELTMEAIIAEDPDFIFVVPMGNEKKALQSMHDIFELNPAWAGLTAVKEGRYVILPKELFHYKPNARWGESYEYLDRIIYG